MMDIRSLLKAGPIEVPSPAGKKVELVEVREGSQDEATFNAIIAAVESKVRAEYAPFVEAVEKVYELTRKRDGVNTTPGAEDNYALLMECSSIARAALATLEAGTE